MSRQAFREKAADIGFVKVKRYRVAVLKDAEADLDVVSLNEAKYVLVKERLVIDVMEFVSWLSYVATLLEI